MTEIRVIDTETTGLDHTKDAIVEIASAMLEKIDGTWWRGNTFSSLVNPVIGISPEASAVHHIVDEDVRAAPSLDAALETVLNDKGLSWREPERNGRMIFAAHNAPFDMGFLPELAGHHWIDTCRAAKHIWPDAPAYGNQVLRYWLGIDLPRDGVAHRALFDTIVTREILLKMLETHSLREIHRLSWEPVLLKKVGFGVHFGKLWSEVPGGYLDWCSRTAFDDGDINFTVEQEIARRAAASQGA